MWKFEIQKLTANVIGNKKLISNPHPDDQIEANFRDEILLKRGLCPYCAPQRVEVRIFAHTEKGWAFHCPAHGRCGRATKTLALCYTRRKYENVKVVSN